MSIQAPEARPTRFAQWAIVVVTVLLSAGLAVVLPRVAMSTVPADTQLTAGERVEAGGVSIVPAEGWALTGGTDFLIISKQDSKLLIFPPEPGETTAKDAVVEAEKVYTEDKTIQATLGDIRSFTTDSGLDAAEVTVAEPDAVSGLYAFSSGTELSNGSLSTSPTTYADQAEEIDGMLASVEFSGGSES